MIEWRCRENNSTRVIILSVTSKKVSNRSKNGSLDIEKCYCKVRALRRGVSKLVFLYKTWFPFVNIIKEIQILQRKSGLGTPRLGARTLQEHLSASNEPFFDRLDTFFDVTDEIITLVLLFSRHLHPIIDSGR